MQVYLGPKEFCRCTTGYPNCRGLLKKNNSAQYTHYSDEKAEVYRSKSLDPVNQLERQT